MSAKKRLVRISCTVPEDVVAEADSIAEAEQRSRSWVVSEAIRRYAGGAPQAPRMVREVARPPDAGSAAEPVGLDPMRRLQLQADMRLTPEDRVKAAEETATLGYLLHPPTGSRLVQFDRYEDYLTWKRREEIRG